MGVGLPAHQMLVHIVSMIPLPAVLTLHWLIMQSARLCFYAPAHKTLVHIVSMIPALRAVVTLHATLAYHAKRAPVRAPVCACARTCLWSFLVAQSVVFFQSNMNRSRVAMCSLRLQLGGCVSFGVSYLCL